MRGIAKRFGAASARHGKCANDIGVLEAIRGTRAADELANESGVKTVSRAHDIDRGDGRRETFQLFRAAPSVGALRDALDDHQRYFRGADYCGLAEIGRFVTLS